MLLAITSLLGYLAIFAGTVAPIWLLLVGQWRVVLYGIVAGVALPYVMMLAELPGFALGSLVPYFARKNIKGVVAVCAFLGVGYQMFLITIWTLIVYTAVTNLAAGIGHTVPLLAWGYAVVLGPLSYMAGREPDQSGSATTLGLAVAVLSYISLLFLGLTKPAYVALWVLIVVAAVYQSVWVMKVARQIREEALVSS